jgi:hypothetical protein
MMGGISFQKNSIAYPLGNEAANIIFHKNIGITRTKQFDAYFRICLFIICLPLRFCLLSISFAVSRMEPSYGNIAHPQH